MTLALAARLSGPDLELAEVLPEWVLWGRYVALPLVAFALTWILARIELGICGLGMGDLAGKHWTERARALWPLRRAPLASLVATVVFFYLLFGSHLGAGGQAFPPLLLAATALASYSAFLLERYRARKRFAPVQSPAAYLRGHATFLLLFASPLIAALALFAFPSARSTAATIAWSAAVLFSFTGGGLFLAWSAGLARAASRRVRDLVSACAARAGVPVRGVFEIDLAMANAFAFPIPSILGFTPRAQELLDDEELRGITLHELGHLRERWRFVVTRLGAVAILVLAAFRLQGRPSSWSVLALALLAIAILLALRSVSRRAEGRADAFAADESDRAAFARALARIYEANLVPAVLRASTHPSLYDRLLAAGVSPDYPRPRAPSRLRPLIALAAVIALAGAAGTSAFLAARNLWERRDDRPAVLLSLSMFGPEPDKLADLALLEYSAKDLETSARLFRAATRLDPESPWWHADLALVLAQSGRCEEARIALAVAEELAVSWTTDIDLLGDALQNARDSVAACASR